MRESGARALRRTLWGYRLRLIAVLVAVPTVLTMWPLEVARSWRHDEEIRIQGPVQVVEVESVRDSRRKGVCTRIYFTTSDGYRRSMCGTEDRGDTISVVTDGDRVLRVDDHDSFAVSVGWGSGVAVLASLAIALYGAGRGMAPLTAIRSVRRRPTSVVIPELDQVWERDFSLHGWRRWWRRGKNHEFYRLRLHTEDGTVIVWSGRLRAVRDEADGRRFPSALWWESVVLVGDVQNGGWAWLSSTDDQDPGYLRGWRRSALDLQPPTRPLEFTQHEDWRGPWVKAEPPDIYREPRDTAYMGKQVLMFLWRYRAR